MIRMNHKEIRQLKKERRRYRKDSLKSRTNHILNITNLITVVLMMIGVVVLIGGLFSILGYSYSKYSANVLAKYTSTVLSKDELNNDTIEDVFVSSISSLNIEELRDVSDNGEIDLEMSIFEYKVWLKGNDQPIIDSLSNVWSEKMLDAPQADSKNKELLPLKQDSKLIQLLCKEAMADILDDDGNVVGNVSFRISPGVVMFFYAFSMAIGIGLLIANNLLTKIIGFVLTAIVSRPVESLVQQMNALSQGNVEEALMTEIKVKRPASEVKSLMASTNTIMHKIRENTRLLAEQNHSLEEQTAELESQTEELEAQKDELEAQNIQLHESEARLQAINDAYLSRTLKLQNILNNVGQGFLTFGKDLTINSEYSMACELMMAETACKNLTGMIVTEAMDMETEQKEFIKALLVKIFEASPDQQKLYMSLLPDEMEIGTQIMHLDFKLVLDEHSEQQMMMIMTDITEKRQLEQQMETEQLVLQMIVKVLLNRDDFLTLLDQFNIFTKNAHLMVGIADPQTLMREIHTFKGSFSQYDLQTLVQYLNNVEAISEDKMEELKEVLSEEILQKALQTDLEVIETYVGKAFFDTTDSYTVKEDKILEIEQKIRAILPAGEYRKVIPIIQSIRYKSVRNLLKGYPDYVTKLSERLGKSVEPFEIQGDDVYVDQNVYDRIMKTMVHVYRNAVDHGIETEDERAEQDKPLVAKITTQVRATENGFDIIVRDDGAGINVERLKTIALERNLITKEMAELMSDDEARNLIFMNGLTTKSEATIISGRGVGLSALQKEVTTIGGSVVVHSVEHEFTEIIISLPMITSSDVYIYEPEMLMKTLAEFAEEYFESLQLKLQQTALRRLDRIVLQKSSALLSIKGSVDGIFLLSVNRQLGMKLAKAFILDELHEDELSNYIEDVLGELTNTLMGHVLEKLEEQNIYLSIGIPAMLTNTDATVKYGASKILTIGFGEGDDMLSMNLLIVEGNDEIIQLN